MGAPRRRPGRRRGRGDRTGPRRGNAGPAARLPRRDDRGGDRTHRRGTDDPLGSAGAPSGVRPAPGEAGGRDADSDRRPTVKRRIAAVLAAAAWVTLTPALASAHPLGNFTINHYAGLVVGPSSVALDVVIDMAEIPTLDVIADIDADGDGRATGDELAVARAGRCLDLLPQLSLTVAGGA